MPPESDEVREERYRLLRAIDLAEDRLALLEQERRAALTELADNQMRLKELELRTLKERSWGR